MAGIVSTLSTAVEAVTGLASLAFGSTGGVVLGDFTFSGFEVPESVPYGGAMMMHVHKMPGGERVVDLMGDDPSDISWSGTIMDGNPESRAAQLRQMAATGAALPLHFGRSFYTVVIRSFEASVMYGRVGYRISCLVLRNEATAILPTDPDLTTGVLGDVTSAINSATSAMAPVITTAQTALTALGPLIPGSPKLGVALASLSGINAQIGGFTASAGAALTGISGAASLSASLANAGTLAQSLQSAAFVGRAIRNLT